MTDPSVPSVPTAEEFAEAHAALRQVEELALYVGNRHLKAAAAFARVRSTLSSAEAAISRLSKEAARWNAVRAKATTGSTLQVWEGGSRKFRYWMIQIPRDGEDESVDEAADRLVSPLESEKP